MEAVCKHRSVVHLLAVNRLHAICATHCHEAVAVGMLSVHGGLLEAVHGSFPCMDRSPTATAPWLRAWHESGAQLLWC